MTVQERQPSEVRIYLLPLTLADSEKNVFCLFSQNQVVEIIGRRPVQHIPFSPAYLKGVVSYQGALLPVVNLDELCNRSQKSGQAQSKQLVVLRTGAVAPATGEPLKIVVAASTGVRTVKLSAQVLADGFDPQEPPLSLAASGIMRGFFQQQATYVALVNLDQIVLGDYAQEVHEVVG